MLPFHTFLLIMLLGAVGLTYEPPVIKTHVIEGLLFTSSTRQPVSGVLPPSTMGPVDHLTRLPNGLNSLLSDGGLFALEVYRNVSTARFSIASHTNQPNGNNTWYTDLWPASELIGGTHRCFPAPGMDVKNLGLNGTIRLKYKRANDPYYSYTCADVTWVHYGDWIKPAHIECSSGFRVEAPALLSVAYMTALLIWVLLS